MLYEVITMRQVGYHREVVADEEIGQAEVPLQIQQQVDDLGLHRDVQRNNFV